MTAVMLSIVGLAFLFVLGTVLYGMVLAAIELLVSLAQDLRARWPVRITRAEQVGSLDASAPVVDPLEISPTDPPELSTEAMWHRMQGTSKRVRRKGQSI